MDHLKHAVIHELKKRGNELPEMHLAPQVLDTTNAIVQELAKALVTVLGTPNNNVHYGQFRGAHRQGEFPTGVEQFTKDGSSKQFMALSRVAMNELAVTAKDKNFSTGGYICFVAYTSHAEDFLLVAMVKERSGFLVDANLRPTTVQPIELSKLHQAARVNLSRYSEVLAGQVGMVPAAPLDFDELAAEDDDGESAANDVDQTYLCFIKGTADEVAAYFQDALGCEPGISASRATGKLIKEVPRFLSHHQDIGAYAPQVRRAVIDYLLSFTNEAPIDLGTVVSVARAAIPVPVSDELIESLNKHLNEKCEIPSHFMVHGATVRRAAVIKAKGPHYSLVFDENAVGEQDAAILYRRDTHSLVVPLLDGKVIERVERAIQARRSGPPQ
jgi:nucleoid-associated protein